MKHRRKITVSYGWHSSGALLSLFFPRKIISNCSIRKPGQTPQIQIQTGTAYWLKNSRAFSLPSPFKPLSLFQAMTKPGARIALFQTVNAFVNLK